MTMALEHRYRVLLDRMGAVGSLLCAVHCALLPLLIALLPSIGVATWLSKDAEEWFVVFASMVGLFSVVWGYRRHREVRALDDALDHLVHRARLDAAQVAEVGLQAGADAVLDRLAARLG